MRQWTFDIVANRQRRADWAGANLSAPINAKSQSKVELPGEHEPLHDIAAQHREALEKLKPDDNGFVHLNSAALFRCEISVAMVPKLTGDSRIDYSFGEKRLSSFTWKQRMPAFEPDAR